MLRRSPTALQPVLIAGQLAYDPATALLTANGETVALPPRERALCEALMRDVGRLVPRRRLETTLSDYDSELTANALDLAVSRLRKRFEGIASGVEIATVRGVGYLMRECTDDASDEMMP
jgi:DNA-binding response OmpR family regulator